jgi:DNA-directed RNA polymerase specialized sigma24 family protein
VIDYARQRRTLRKGGRQFEITLTEDVEGSLGFGETNISQLGEALELLTGIDQSLAELVDLHFFCGFSFAEIAQFRDVSERTVQRDWRKARMLLHNALSEALDVRHNAPGS